MKKKNEKVVKDALKTQTAGELLTEIEKLLYNLLEIMGKNIIVGRFSVHILQLDTDTNGQIVYTNYGFLKRFEICKERLIHEDFFKTVYHEFFHLVTIQYSILKDGNPKALDATDEVYAESMAYAIRNIFDNHGELTSLQNTIKGYIHQYKQVVIND